MKELSVRTAGFTDSVIRRMTRISNKYGAINLSQGFPDFEPPEEILKRLAEVSGEDFHQYSITWGAQNFREALAAKQKQFMGIDIDPDKEIFYHRLRKDKTERDISGGVILQYGGFYGKKGKMDIKLEILVWNRYGL